MIQKPTRFAVPSTPAERIAAALAEDDVGRALELARLRVGDGGASPEAWFSLSAALAARTGGRVVPWLDLLEAEREAAGGLAAEARQRLDRIAAHPEASAEERRRARLRAAELSVRLGEHAAAARRAAAWRRDHPDAPEAETARGLRLGAEGLAREGRTDCALALLDEAEGSADRLALADRLDLALARAHVFGLAGRFAEEDRIYAEWRAAALGSGDERLAARFLAQEARGLLDRRDFSRAALRFEEALGAADDAADRAALSIDLAATRYHAGDREGSERALAEALANAAAAGREDLARLARGNRIELLLDRCAFDEAGAEIAVEHAEAVRSGDERRRLVALHHRARLALRRGELEAARRDNAAARALAESLADRLEIGELWLEDGDRAACQGDREGARRSWEKAAEDPPDRCDTDRLARERLSQIAGEGPPPALADALERRFEDDAASAAETVARWCGLFGADRVPAGLRERAGRVFERLGAGPLAALVIGARSAAAPPDAALRALRGAVAGVLAGDGAGAERTLPLLGLSGLRLREPGGRELLRLETGAVLAGEERWRPLEAGAARFELGLSPQVPEETGAAVALVLESLLHRVTLPASTASDFEEGWRRLGLVTGDASMEEPWRRLARFAPQGVTVLVLGESGSGKEAVARAVHRLSPRASGPFVAVNVPAIPAALAESELFGHARGAFSGADRDRKGLLEEAHGGTVFFDEIGDLPPPLQSKLLRALQEREVRRLGENRPRPVDVRIVSATSRELEKEVEAGRFREDLFYRLHVACLRLPALRERGRDALLLARHFLERFGREYGRGPLRLAPESGAAILEYPWPGNVRELENAMAQAAALSDGAGPIGPELLPSGVRGARRSAAPRGDYRASVDAHRRDLIADALERSGGNRSRAARELGLSRQALLYLIKELKVGAGRS
jgi:DNA-binding NtrC family response regulator